MPVKHSLETDLKRGIIFGVGAIIITCIIFWHFANQISANELHRFDLRIMNLIHSFISDGQTRLMKLITFMGATRVILISLILVVFLMLVNRKWWEAVFFFIAVSGASFFNLVLKWIFQRERPYLNPIVIERGYSFPSAHAMVSLVFYGMLAYLLMHFAKRRVFKIIIVIAFSILIFMIGVSRIYLGVHYPSDVIAGFAAGTGWLIACTLCLRINLVKRKTNL